MTLIEKLSVFSSSVISLAIAYSHRVPSQNNNNQMKMYFADGLNGVVIAFKNFLENTQGNLNLDTMSTIDLDDALDALSLRNECMRTCGVPANEISRASQYINKMSDTIEFIMLFKFYTTSRLMRNFLTFLIFLGVVIFAPYYSTIDTIGMYIGPLFACIFSAALNIQRILDNPINGTKYIDQIQTNFTSRFHMRIQEILFDDNNGEHRWENIANAL